MKTTLTLIISTILLLTAAITLNARDYSVYDFVGTWHGTIESEWNYYSEEITITFYPDGTYMETSGRLLPSIYQNTQTWDIDYENDRLHFQYLRLVYAGRRTYQHYYFDIVNFKSDMFELHYNFWNDPEPNPEAQKLVLSKFTTSVDDADPLKSKTLLRVINFNGEELPLDTKNTPAIYQYDDGSVEKKLIRD